MRKVIGFFEGRNAYDLTAFEADHARVDDIFGLESRPAREVHVLTGVELGLYDAGADDLDFDAGFTQLHSEKLEEGEEEGLAGGVHGALGQLGIFCRRAVSKRRGEADN